MSRKYTDDVLAELEAWVRSQALKPVTRDDFRKRFPWVNYGSIVDLYGFSIKRIQRDERLRISLKYVRQGKPYKWVARKVKYSNHMKYWHAFRDHFGMTPLQYVKSKSRKKVNVYSNIR